MRGGWHSYTLRCAANCTGVREMVDSPDPRVLPDDCNAVIKKSSWPRPKVFNFLQQTGPVDEEEMFRVFNMGIGFVVVVAEDFADAVARRLIRYGEKVNRIGRITRGTGKVVLKD